MTFDDYIYFERKDAAEEAAQEAALSTTIQNILDLLEDYGEVPEAVCDYLNAQTDLSVLKTWLKIAARTPDLETFMEEIGCGVATVS